MSSPDPNARAGWPLLVILTASLALKLALLVPAHATFPIWDSWDYFRVARHIHDTGDFIGRRPPLYPYVLAGAIHLSALGGDQALTPTDRSQQLHPRRPVSDLDLIRGVQVAISTLSVWLIFLLGREIFDRRAALMAAGLFAFLPELVGLSHLLWSETVFIALNLGWAVLLFQGLRRKHVGLLCASGAVLALAALTRQVVASFLLPMLVWLFVMRPSPFRDTARLGAALALGFVVVLAPWTVRNAVAHGVFAPIAPRGGLALLYGVSDDVSQELRNAGATFGVGPIEIDRRAGQRARELIARDPARYARRVFFENLPDLWAADSYVLRYVAGASPAQRKMIGYPAMPGWLERALIILFVGSYLALLALAIAGAAMAPDWRSTLLTVGLVMHATALHALLSANVRHRVYLLAFATLYAGFALSRRPSEWRGLLGPRRLAFLGASSGLLALAILGADHTRLVQQWIAAG